VRERVEQLTQREHEVLQQVVAGRMNREIAERLDISIKTVEAHRARIMEKLEVSSVAELVQSRARGTVAAAGGETNDRVYPNCRAGGRGLASAALWA
jgi:DNA-binding CsgD family transcriptional regulator